MAQSIRFDLLSKRDINKETFVEPWPEAGLIVADSPYDPQPSLAIEDGRVLEMDGKACDSFDALDQFIVSHALNLDLAEDAMAIPSREYARMLADINVPRGDIARLIAGCTPAKLTDIIRHMNVLEMMMGLAKMRIRRVPANQAHVTNWRGASGIAGGGRGRSGAARIRRSRNDGASGAFCALQRAGDPGRYANRTRRCTHAMLGGRSAGLAAGDERVNQLRGNALGVWYRDHICRWR